MLEKREFDNVSGLEKIALYIDHIDIQDMKATLTDSLEFIDAISVMVPNIEEFNRRTQAIRMVVTNLERMQEASKISVEAK